MIALEVARVFGEVARLSAEKAVRDGNTHPEDIANQVLTALEGAALTLDVLSKEGGR